MNNECKEGINAGTAYQAHWPSRMKADPVPKRASLHGRKWDELVAQLDLLLLLVLLLVLLLGLLGQGVGLPEGLGRLEQQLQRLGGLWGAASGSGCRGRSGCWRTTCATACWGAATTRWGATRRGGRRCWGTWWAWTAETGA